MSETTAPTQGGGEAKGQQPSTGAPLRMDAHADGAALRAQRLAELTMDLEDRSSKKGTPPRPSEAGVLSRRGRQATDMSS